MNQPDYELERQRMVSEQIARRGLNDERLLDAFGRLPRHLFVPDDYSYLAYDDGPLPIGYGQTISQPYIVALMTDLLCLKGDERVLEIGTGSGYQAAILAYLAAEVQTIEFVPELGEQAEKLVKELGFDNIYCHVGDGSLGWPHAAPYSGIIVTAAAPDVPKALLGQLEEGGRLVLPVGGRGFQELECWRRRGRRFDHKAITGVAFVPLRGEHGWDRDRW
jgi:protein-L-isoaspartate(D-aspartate) O-methyltransferase